MKQKYFSIIGCQHAHISVFIEEMFSLGYECSGIYDEDDLWLAKKLSTEYNIKLVDDKMKLLNSEVSVVGCAAINNKKIDVIELCEQYGKHIMLDKPIVTNNEDFERLKNVIRNGKIEIGMLLTERFRSSLYTLREEIKAGTLGEIVSISMRKPHLLRPSSRPEWHFSKEQCGGIIIDLFIHDFDLLRWLTNQEITSCSGYVSKNILKEYPSFYDVASLNVELSEGVIANLYADWHTPTSSWTWGDCRIFVVGTKGVAEVRLEGDPLITENEEIIIQVTKETEAERISCKKILFTITEDFLRRINTGKSEITHKDILSTIEATLKGDQEVKYLNNLA